MLQVRYRSFVELDNFVSLVHLNWFTKEQSSLLLIMPVLCGVIKGNISKLQRAQNYAASIATGNFDYVNFRSADLSYELN